MGMIRSIQLLTLAAGCTCLLQKNDGYPDPRHAHPLYEVTTGELTKNCDWGSVPMGDIFDSSIMNFYPSTEHWKNYSGVRVIPEQSHSGHLFTKPFNDYPFKDLGIQGGRCDVPLPDESTWTFDRIGPFKTTGNYDWWQFAWSNALDFKSKSEQHPGKGIFLLNTISAAVDDRGEMLNFPPIHVHHVHHTPGLGGPFTFNPFCSIEEALGIGTMKDCKGNQRILDWIHEQHGDYQCKDSEGGLQCLIEGLPGGYAKLVDGPLSVDGEMNDVRAPNSPEMTWYVLVGARWIPNDASILARSPIHPRPRPISSNTIWAPGRTDLSDQSTMVHTFLAPTGFESFMWYTGRMWTSGKLIRGKTHTHNQVFQQMYIFKGSPEKLGLDKRFRPRTPYESIDTRSIGFESNRQLRDYVIERYEETRLLEGEDSVRVVCETNTSYDVIDGYLWDRRSDTGCSPWDFKEGDQFTVIGFHGVPPWLKSVGPHMPGRLTPFIPVHLGYFWLYDSGDGESHYSATFYTQDVEHSSTSGELGDMRALPAVFGKVWNGGTQSLDEFRNFMIVSSAFAMVAACLAVWGCIFSASKLKKLV